MEIAVLVLNSVISFVIPLAIWIVLICRNRDERKGIVILFVLDALMYVGMQWGIKQHGLAYLFNHTDFTEFMNNRYITYLFVVALAGAVLAVIPELIIIIPVYRGRITFKQAVSMGLGYAAAESSLLVGYQSVMSIVGSVKDKDTELVVSNWELLLSGYERVLLTVIDIGLVVLMIYLIENKMTVRAVFLKVILQTIIAFLPGFFIAFSMKNYLEVFDRSTTFIMVYIVLTAAAICSATVLNGVKWKMYEYRK